MNKNLQEILTKIVLLLIVSFNPFFVFAQEQNKNEISFEEAIENSRNSLNVNLNESLAYAQKALSLTRKDNNLPLVYEARNQIAVTLFYMGLFQEAADNWLACDSLAKLMKDEFLIAKSNFQISALYLALDDFVSARKFLSIAKNYFESQNYINPNYVIYKQQIMNNLAIIYKKMDQANLSEKYFIEAINLAKSKALYSQLKTTLGAYSSFLLDNKKYTEALNIVQELQEINLLHNYNVQIESTNLLKLHRIFKELNHQNFGDSLLVLGYKLAQKSNSLSLIRETSFELYSYEKQLGNALNAIKYKEIYDSILIQEKQLETLHNLELIRLREEFKSREINYLSAENQIKKKSKLIISVLLMLVVGSLIYLYQKVLQTQRFKSAKAYTEALNDKIKLENNELSNKLKVKDEIITAQTIQQITQTKKIISTLEKINHHEIGSPNNTLSSNKELKKIIQNLSSEKEWDYFDTRFVLVNHDFYKKLEALVPDLTANEKRLSALLKLELTTKEITQVTGQTVRAVEIARTRLRKKLGIKNQDISLVHFLKNL